MCLPLCQGCIRSLVINKSKFAGAVKAVPARGHSSFLPSDSSARAWPNPETKLIGMKPHLITFIMVLWCVPLKGQIQWEGRVLDSDNKAPVEYAHIEITGTGLGTVSDSWIFRPLLTPHTVFGITVSSSRRAFLCL